MNVIRATSGLVRRVGDGFVEEVARAGRAWLVEPMDRWVCLCQIRMKNRIAWWVPKTAGERVRAKEAGEMVIGCVELVSYIVDVSGRDEEVMKALRSVSRAGRVGVICSERGRAVRRVDYAQWLHLPGGTKKERLEKGLLARSSEVDFHVPIGVFLSKEFREQYKRHVYDACGKGVVIVSEYSNLSAWSDGLHDDVRSILKEHGHSDDVTSILEERGLVQGVLVSHQGLSALFYFDEEEGLEERFRRFLCGMRSVHASLDERLREIGNRLYEIKTSSCFTGTVTIPKNVVRCELVMYRGIVDFEEGSLCQKLKLSVKQGVKLRVPLNVRELELTTDINLNGYRYGVKEEIIFEKGSSCRTMILRRGPNKMVTINIPDSVEEFRYYDNGRRGNVRFGRESRLEYMCLDNNRGYGREGLFYPRLGMVSVPGVIFERPLWFVFLTRGCVLLVGVGMAWLLFVFSGESGRKGE